MSITVSPKDSEDGETLITGCVGPDGPASSAPVPVTTLLAPPPPEKPTVPLYREAAAGLNRTGIVVDWPGASTYEVTPGREKPAPEIRATPLSCADPVLVTVNDKSDMVPKVTLPKANDDGVTLMAAAGGGPDRTPRPLTGRVVPPPPENETMPVNDPSA